ncbi:unnamed protein product [Prorocentrum cordatum]|uniref:Copper transporter n=1 Tax=Prorocentrum cordatum TaxID=2364126 RepID=A0ABN9XD59_9DINO|nr:unnamed protein product [Polarella glacialis]
MVGLVFAIGIQVFWDCEIAKKLRRVMASPPEAKAARGLVPAPPPRAQGTGAWGRAAGAGCRGGPAGAQRCTRITVGGRADFSHLASRIGAGGAASDAAHRRAPCAREGGL